MPYTLSFSFGAPPAATLEAVLLDSANAPVGTAITAGFVEVGQGWHGWTGAIPDGHRGFLAIRGQGGGDVHALFAVNPEEGEHLDEAVSAPKQIDLDQAVPAADVSAKTTQTVGDCLSVARAEGAGRWVLDEANLTLTIYGPDGTTAVRTFALDSTESPMERS